MPYHDAPETFINTARYLRDNVLRGYRLPDPAFHRLRSGQYAKPVEAGPYLAFESIAYLDEIDLRANDFTVANAWRALVSSSDDETSREHRYESSETLTLDEYVEFVEREVDLSDLSSLESSVPKFRALMNNPKLVTDALNRDLEDWGTFQTGNTYTAQTLRLGNGKVSSFGSIFGSRRPRLPEVRQAEGQNFTTSFLTTTTSRS